MKQIPLTQGMFALVDDEDFEYLNQWKWCVEKQRNKYYAARRGESGQHLYMHRVILSDKTQIDHEDGNGLNNQKYNLREATYKENGSNRAKQKNNTSGFKGVFSHRNTKKWRAQIVVNKKAIHLGYFTTAEEAAIAYNEAAIKYHGSFAKLNQV